MEHYDTTPEQVEAAAQQLGVSQQLAHALLERGHTVEEASALTAREMFREFCLWNGLIGWADTLECILDEARAASPR